jgi:fructose-bisphosphate aldolase class II
MPDPFASLAPFGDAVRVADGRVHVARPAALATAATDALAREAVFGPRQQRDQSRWLLWELGQALGVRAASIYDLYMARGRGEVEGFTVPVINLRGLTYDVARSVFRTAIRLEAGAFILEIARTEMAYTDQRPPEYAAVVLAAALREGFRGPVFLQGNHFDVSARKFAADAAGEIAAVKQLALEAVMSGLYNIDLDTSTLVDASRASEDEQQRFSYETAADLVSYIRQIEPAGVTVSAGCEVGEVGNRHSTPAQLRAFLNGFNGALVARSARAAGLSKVGVQTNAPNDEVVHSDRRIAEPGVDLEALAGLSRVAQSEFGLAGAVNGGGSTLTEAALAHFPEAGIPEVHLTSSFQDLLFDLMPQPLKARIYTWLGQRAQDERLPGDSDDQVYERTRKWALGAFKRELWDLQEPAKERYAAAYDETLSALFTRLGVAGTAATVAKYVQPAEQHHRAPGTGPRTVAVAPGESDTSE